MASIKDWLPAKAYAYQPNTGALSQMSRPIYDIAAARLAEEQKQRDLGREKIMNPDGTFYYRDTPGVNYPGRTAAENAYYSKVNATPSVQLTATPTPSKPAPTPNKYALTTSSVATPSIAPATSPAGNNIASSAATPVNPNTAMSGTQLSSATPNTGTIQSMDNVFENPISGTTKKRKPLNKYFDQQWFGNKPLA